MPKKKNRNTKTRKDGPAVEELPVGNESEVFNWKKYGRRQIESNWDRYKPESSELEEASANKYDDFAALLNTPSDCNYFRFQSEKDWDNLTVSSSFGGHSFFNLDLELLSNGLSCIPFYDRVALDKSILSESDIENCDKKAEQSASRYKMIKEKFLRKVEREKEYPRGDVETKVDVMSKMSEKQAEPDVSSTNLTKKSEDTTQFISKQELPKIHEQKTVKHVNSGDEDLEDWLDSVLDD